MTKQQRKKQLKSRIIKSIGFSLALTAVFTLAPKGNGKSDPYYIADPTGFPDHYKLVQDYKANATYIGNCLFLTEDGNEWEVLTDTEFQKGKRYTITFCDNGTEELEDDIIKSIK